MDDKLRFKLILLGDTGVGKTSLAQRRVYNEFNDHIPMTVGVSNYNYIEKIQGRKIEINIWDTAGQEQFSALIPMFSRNSNVCILVCDLNSLSSMKHLEQWQTRLKDSGYDPPIVVAVNKIDLAQNFDDNSISPEGNAILNSYENVHFVSAVTGDGVSNLFRDAAIKAYENSSFSKQNNYERSKNLNGDEGENNCSC